MSENIKNIRKEEAYLQDVTIRFSGDSGDGMQLTGSQFSQNTAIFGNDLATFPDYPAEIRAPLGSLAGVSSFQIQFSSRDIHTPGDQLDVLVAMNPAALKVHLKDLKDNGIILVNEANFSKRNLALADWDENPLTNKLLKNFRVISVDMTTLVKNATSDLNLKPKTVARSANMFALGLMYWLYGRELKSTINFLKTKFSKRPNLVESNDRALKAGFNFGETIEAVKTTYRVPPAVFDSGTYRNIMGNQAICFGLMAAANKSGLDLFYGGYPITPASDILHYLASCKQFGVKTFQAEDEIAGVVSVIGASFAGNLGVTATSGPGMALKSEALGLAITTELPIVVINVQRGGPSTGLPTKTEQSDLSQAFFGRNGEAPIPVIAASTPADCFDTAFEACRIALEHMIPIILLTDAFISNGSEPWKIPSLDSISDIRTNHTTNPDNFHPFHHDEQTLARPWALPGTPGLEHRVGGLEKSENSGDVNYLPENHERMTNLRQEKIDILADSIPLIKVHGDDQGQLLVVGWGSTYGAIRSAVNHAQSEGFSVSHVHLTYLNPFPKNLGDVIQKFEKVLIPEMNMGQLLTIIRSKFLVDAQGLNKIQGRPFNIGEIFNKIKEMIGK